MIEIMRVKIKGEVTAERLIEALQAAVEKYEAVRPGHKIYGANLYLNAFDADGLPFDLAGRPGEPLSITIEAKAGDLVKPALTAEGESRRQEAKRRVDEANARVEERHRQAQEEFERERQKRREIVAKNRSSFEYANVITSKLLESSPEQFVSELNKIVQSVWNDLKPVEPHGRKKGEQKPIPTFSADADGLLLYVETSKHPRRVTNPICSLNRSGEFVYFWMNEAWKEATNRITAFMEAQSKSMAQKEAGE